MTDSNEPNNVLPLFDGIDEAIKRVKKNNPTGAVILYTYEDPADFGMESIGIHYTGRPTFKDFTALLFAFQTFISRTYK